MLRAIGRQLGVRASGRGGDNVSTLEGAILGLLALMIGFTFAMALARFETRRDAVLNEANAIGTTALRARLLPAPYGVQALKLLQEYVQVRLDITRRVPSPAELNAAISRSNALQEALWQQAKAVALKDNGMVPTGLRARRPARSAAISVLPDPPNGSILCGDNQCSATGNAIAATASARPVRVMTDSMLTPFLLILGLINPISDVFDGERTLF